MGSEERSSSLRPDDVARCGPFAVSANKDNAIAGIKVTKVRPRPRSVWTSAREVKWKRRLTVARSRPWLRMDGLAMFVRLERTAPFVASVVDIARRRGV